MHTTTNFGKRQLSEAIRMVATPVQRPQVDPIGVQRTIEWTPAVPTFPDSHKYTQAPCYAKSSDIRVARGAGCHVFDAEGRRFLDVTSGIAVLSTGHCHPRVVEAIQKQSANLLHGQLNCFQSHGPLEGLLPRLGKVMPKGIDTFVVDTTGTQAIEAAVKLARRHTKRPNIICMTGGFHGRTAMCTAMTSSNTGPRCPVATPLPSGVYFTPYPMAFRWGMTEEQASERALQDFRDLLKSQVSADMVAAMVIEPVLGEGGFVPMSQTFISEAAKICRENGILLIADEVQAGMGRTGKMWGSDYFPENAKPDIIVSAKGIASGMPLSVIGSSRAIMESFGPGSHGGTYMGNPLACAAACATIDTILEEKLVENSHKMGGVLKGYLSDIRDTYIRRCDVRGLGLMIGLECRDANGSASPAMAKFIQKHCLSKSNVLLYSPSGWDGCVLRIMPPLIIKSDEVFRIACAVEYAAKEWSSGARSA